MHAMVGWAVIGGCLLVGAASAGEAKWLERTLARSDRTEAAAVVWGQESGDRRWVGIMDPPHFTRDPERVEVIEVVRYTDVTWQRAERLARAWRESLPESVYVVRMPTGAEGNARHAFADHWPVHQRAYFAGRMLGIERRVHEAIAAMVAEHPLALGFDWQVRDLAERVGVAPEVFERWVGDPRAVAWARMASRVNQRRMWAEEVRGANVNRLAVYPSLLINGRFAVSGSVAGSTRKAYRVANRIIREEIERGDAHEGPTNGEVCKERLAAREGEVYRRVAFGKKFKFHMVYSTARREVWGLDAGGGVRWLWREVGAGDASYTELVRGEPEVSPYTLVWRTCAEYVSVEGESGPQRYGAFLLTDWLSAPETLWVGLPFKGREVAFAFTPDGKVEARNDKGALFGTWWLEAGNLNVSFGEMGIESWPWQEAAAHVGFEVPERSLTPWKFKKGRKGSAGGREPGDGR